MLCILQSELDVDKFLTMSDNFIQRWNQTEAEFVTYIQTNYFNRAGKHVQTNYCLVFSRVIYAEKWAKCYRKFQHADTDTNMYLERLITLLNAVVFHVLYSFHNKLKTSYLNGKVNRRVDVLLEVLLKIEHDQYFQYEMKHRLQQQNKTVKRDHCRHKRGMSIPCSKVEVLKDINNYYNEHELVMYVQSVGCQ